MCNVFVYGRYTTFAITRVRLILNYFASSGEIRLGTIVPDPGH
jgi:hypothetical protein